MAFKTLRTSERRLTFVPQDVDEDTTVVLRATTHVRGTGVRARSGSEASNAATRTFTVRRVLRPLQTPGFITDSPGRVLENSLVTLAAYEVPRVTVNEELPDTQESQGAGAKIRQVGNNPDFEVVWLRHGTCYSLGDTIYFTQNGEIESIAVDQGGEGYITPPAVQIAAPPADGSRPVVQATAVARISDGEIVRINVDAGGSRYSIPPTVEIDPPPSQTQATVEALIDDTGSVSGFTNLMGGTGYTYDRHERPFSPVVIDHPPPGQQATATTTITNGVLDPIGTITNGGSGYTRAPRVTIAPSPSGIRANAIALISNGVVTQISITDGATLYDMPPQVSIDPPGITAEAVAAIEDGSIVGIIITEPGTGYVSPPGVTIVPANNPARALANLNEGVVTSIGVVDSGHGYDPSNPPAIRLVGDGTGAQASAIINRVVGIDITYPGYGYNPFNPPLITIAGGAEATASIRGRKYVVREEDLDEIGALQDLPEGIVDLDLFRRVFHGGDYDRIDFSWRIVSGGGEFVGSANRPIVQYRRTNVAVNTSVTLRCTATARGTGAPGVRGQITAETQTVTRDITFIVQDHIDAIAPTFDYNDIVAIDAGSETADIFVTPHDGEGTYDRITYQWRVISVGVTPARASATVQGGRITGVTVNNGGAGYTSPPTVRFISNGPGSGAQATAVLSATGQVVAVMVTAGGSGYRRIEQVQFIEDQGSFDDANSRAVSYTPPAGGGSIILELIATARGDGEHADRNTFDTATIREDFIAYRAPSWDRDQIPIQLLVNQPFSFIVPAPDPGYPFPVYSATGLPAGLEFNPATREISGTLVSPTSGTIVVTATNDYASATIDVNYTSQQLPNFIDAVGTPIAGRTSVAIAAVQVPQATGFPTPTYAVVGNLPAGLEFNPTTRQITGTPTALGSGTITIRATNSAGTADWTVAYTIETFELVVPTLAINDVASITEIVTQQFVATPTGGNYDEISYAWSLSGIGTLDTTTGDTVVYTPANISAEATVTIQCIATVRGTGTTAMSGTSDTVTATETFTVTVSSIIRVTATTEMDKTVIGGLGATLTGSAVVFNGDGPTTYQWTQLTGTTVELTDADTETASFTAPDDEEVLTFRFTATNSGVSDSDDIMVIVDADLRVAITSLTTVLGPMPTFALNERQQVVASQRIVGFTGTYLQRGIWTKISGPDIMMYGGFGSSATTITEVTNSNRRNHSDQINIEILEAGTVVLQYTTLVTIGNERASDTAQITLVGTDQTIITPVHPGVLQTTPQAFGAVINLLPGGRVINPVGPTTYAWRQTAGTTGAFSDTAIARPTFTIPQGVAGETITLELTVTNNGVSATGTIDIQVAATEVVLSDAMATVLHGAMFQFDLRPIIFQPVGATTYAWSQMSGDEVTLSSTTVENPTFTAPSTSQTLVFSVTVTNDGISATATITIAVVAAPTLVSVVASDDQSLTEGDTVSLLATATVTNPVGDTTYAWDQIEGPEVTLGNTMLSSLTFVAPASVPPVLYMTGPGAGDFFTVNAATGVATRVGGSQVLGQNFIEGLASHQGALYAVGSRFDALYRINPTTGEPTRIGNVSGFGVSEFLPTGLASHAGLLYMVGQATDALYTVDPATGVATQVGTASFFGAGVRIPGGLASHAGQLYMVGAQRDALYTVDTTTGIATRVGTATEFGAGVRIPTGLTSHVGLLYLVDAGTHALYTVDTTTGVATQVGSATEFGVGATSPIALASFIPDFRFQVTATNNMVSATDDVLVQVIPRVAAPEFADDTGDPISINTNDNIDLLLPLPTGHPAPTFAVVGNLPAGITFDPVTRVLSGRPERAGTGTITIRATNTEGSDDWTVAYVIVEAQITVDAGDDQTVIAGDLVTLMATATVVNPVGDTTYAWRQTDGTEVTLSDTMIARPTFTAPAVTGGTPYLVEDRLFSVDPDTGVATPIGPDGFGVSGSAAVGFTYHNGVAYLVVDSALYTLDLDTGLAIRVGNPTQYPFGGASATEILGGSIAFLGDTLYMLWNGLYTLDITTGLATRVGSISGANALSIAAYQGTMYLSDFTFRSGSASSALYTLDVTTRAVTRVGSATNWGISADQVVGLAAYGEGLYGIASFPGPSSALVAIDPTTGVAAQVGSAINWGIRLRSADALAVVPAQETFEFEVTATNNMASHDDSVTIAVNSN